MRKVLNVSEPLVRGWVHHAYCLSMLQGNEKTYDWIFGNYISTYFSKIMFCGNFELISDFVFIPIEKGLMEKCPFFETKFIDRKTLIESEEILLNYVIKALEDGAYFHIFIDHKYIKSFSANDHYHDALIYGIDTDKDLVYLADVFEKGLFEFKQCSIREFLDAALNCNLNETEDYMLGKAEVYKIKEDYNYEISMEKVNLSLLSYYNAEPEERFDNDIMISYSFGLGIYEKIIEELKCAISKNPYVDPRIFFLIKEHKYMMKRRFEYLEEKGVCERQDDLIEKYHILMEKADEIIMIAMIYNRKGSETILQKIFKLVSEMHELETAGLKKYLISQNML